MTAFTLFFISIFGFSNPNTYYKSYIPTHKELEKDGWMTEKVNKNGKFRSKLKYGVFTHTFVAKPKEFQVDQVKVNGKIHSYLVMRVSKDGKKVKSSTNCYPLENKKGSFECRTQTSNYCRALLHSLDRDKSSLLRQCSKVLNSLNSKLNMESVKAANKANIRLISREFKVNSMAMGYDNPITKPTSISNLLEDYVACKDYEGEFAEIDAVFNPVYRQETDR